MVVTGFASIAGGVLFTGQDNTTALWRSDGTSVGTRLVRDISPRYLTQFQGRVYFFGDGGLSAEQLWRTDGTADGTVLVKPIAPGSAFNLARVGDLLFFAAGDAANGAKLWRSDGTAGGTLSIGDFSLGGGSFPPSVFAGYKDDVYFFAVDAMGFGLWRSDGTAAGTAKVKDLGAVPQLGSQPKELVASGGSLFFVTYQGNLTYRLWRSDGSPDGTLGIRDFAADPIHTSPLLFPYIGPSSLTAFGNAVFFGANDGVRGRELWKSDGTPEGTSLVKDIRPGSDGSGVNGLLAAGGSVYFAANDGVSGNELWTSDGTEAGTRLVHDIAAGPASSFPILFIGVGGTVYFAAQAPEPRLLWRTDGSEVGTFPLPGALDPIFAGVSGDTVFFSTANGSLWKTDGTTKGTALVSTFPEEEGSVPFAFTPVAGRLFFGVANGGQSSPLWVSDGTEGGTHPIFETSPFPQVTFGPGAFAALGGELYFRADDGMHGPRLWKSDGSRSVLLGSGAFNPFSLTAAPDVVFFGAADHDHGFELWRSDGSETGTILVKDIRTGSFSSLAQGPEPWLVVGRELFFFADDGIHGLELWKSDGTETGTQLVKDIQPGPSGSNPIELTVCNGYLFFAADDGGGYALWRTDGTEAGTLKVSSVAPWNLRASGGLLYFMANGNELWRTSGTPEGTFRIKQIFANSLTDVRGMLFFSGDDGISGSELWKSDGTAEGTVMVKDVLPGPLGSLPSFLTDAGGILLFAASDGVHGREPWRSDGTEAGTFLLDDINPGPASSAPLYLAKVGSRIYFSADDTISGRELWVSPAYDFRFLVPRPAVLPRQLPFRR